MTPKTQSEQTYDSLRADILACHLEPGAKLRINEIAERIGVSLGAVREALLRLGAEGLAVPEAQKGYHVSSLSIDELTEARAEIERIALRRSVERGDLDWETSLVGAWHKLSRLDERARSNGGLRIGRFWINGGSPIRNSIRRLSPRAARRSFCRSASTCTSSRNAIAGIRPR